jgi:hypothetical protein
MKVMKTLKLNLFMGEYVNVEHMGEKNCMYHFGGETRRKEIAWTN